MSRPAHAPVALVTGGSSGIGRAIALAYTREGARVVIAGRRIREGEKVVEQIKKAGGDALFVRTDVSKPAEVESLVKKAVETYGQLDWSCNNAGVEGAKGSITECTEENWDEVIDVNLKGVWLCMRYEISQMLRQGGGAIVNISSVNGFLGSAAFAPYVASKHGVIGLTKSAAKGYAREGIRVNAVCPGSIDTAMIERVDGGPVRSDSWRISRTPMGRIGTPEEIAETVVWLCSEKASYVTGHSLIVDGGLLA